MCNALVIQENSYSIANINLETIDTVQKIIQRQTATTTTDDDDDGVYCLCREPAYGPMIACDSPECPNEWFHFQCVGLDVEPTGEWFCNECNSVS